MVECFSVPGVNDSGVIAGCDAPFPSEQYMAGARRFPMMPMSSDDPAIPMVKEAKEKLKSFDKPFCTFAPRIRCSAGRARYEKNVPGTQGMPDIADAGHFLQEDQARACRNHAALHRRLAIREGNGGGKARRRGRPGAARRWG